MTLSKFLFGRAANTARLAAATLLALAGSAFAQTPTPSPSPSATPPTFSRILVFGDSLSDVGNLRHRMQEKGISYPGGDFNYSDGRFTNSSDTSPSSKLFVGVWHEQLARTFLNMPTSGPSLDGGDDFSFGGATTEDGTRDYTLFDASIFGNVTVTIDNMGKQVDDYITRRTLDPNALFVIWGGGNDLFDNDSASNVTATAARVAMLVNRLANAGARYFLVPNVPPLGGVPRYSDNGTAQAAKNRASSDYRAQLSANLDSTIGMLASQGKQIQVGRMDIWSLFVRFVANPNAYGITDFLHSAQGQGVNPDKYLFWDDIHPTTAAHYQIANEANRVLTGVVQTPARAVNLATRVSVGDGEKIAVGGFIITGSDPKRVVLRGIGPSLQSRGISGALPNPTLELLNAAGTSLSVNDDWKQNPEAAEITALGLAPTNDLESALIQTLAPGSYTVRLSAKDSVAGIGVVEAYDVGATANSNLANLSTRGFVGTGDDVLIGGVIVDNGGAPITVVRAIGPSLAAAGIASPLADPTLTLYDNNGAQIGANDDWRAGQPTAAKATLLAPTDDKEAVIVASLATGNYTAVVRGKNGATGVALVEVYRIP
jgi:phospholipase/lecithinase/hemolysin